MGRWYDLCVRRTAYRQVLWSLSIVPTIGCLHMMLRDNGIPLKMDSPGA